MTRTVRRALLRTLLRASHACVVVAGSLVLVAACGGGTAEPGTGQGGGLDLLGGGQEPDPTVVDVPVLFIERDFREPADPALPTGTRYAPNPVRQLDFLPGARLKLIARAQPDLVAEDLTAVLDQPGAWDVRDLNVSPDGTFAVFAMRGPYDPALDDDEQPTWDLWRYDHVSRILERLITSDLVAGAGHDRYPAVLPDGRILFTSTRQKTSRAQLLDEGKPQYAAEDEDRREPVFNLHVLDPATQEIEQIGFSPSHELAPQVQGDGTVVYSRWDNMPGIDRLSLYRVDPDGSRLTRLYGYHSQASGFPVSSGGSDVSGAQAGFLETRPLGDGRLLAFLRLRDPVEPGGVEPVLLAPAEATDADVPVAGGSAAGAQAPLFVDQTLRVDGLASPGGRYLSVWPLREQGDRWLVSWSQCRRQGPEGTLPCGDPAVREPAGEAAATPVPGLWIFDLADETQIPVRIPVDGVTIDEAVALETVPAPPVIVPVRFRPDTDGDLVDADVGVLDIRSVYDLDGVDIAVPDVATMANPLATPADQRPVHLLRLVKNVPLPDRDVLQFPGTAFGRSQAQQMREILGYARIEPDGSVRTQVPADVSFTLEVLDANGRRVGPRHRNWMQVRAGEVLECVGCHERGSTAPHGRPEAQPDSIRVGAVDGSPHAGTDPTRIAYAGETMAQTRARLDGVPEPMLNIVVPDDWTDTSVRPADPELALRYTDLVTPAPTAPGCLTAWRAECRIRIHYPDHIQPLWDATREILDPADETVVLEDRTCTTCHGPRDAMDAAQVPAAQLDLSGTPSPDEGDHLVSYRELFFNDVEQEVVDGALIDRLVPLLDGDGNVVFERDIDGELILDEEGNPIPVLVTVPVRPILSTGGAGASDRFFEAFEAGGPHPDWLSGAELRLVSEWLDVGAQYYNDPFAVPED